jgi:ribosomal protein S18 acetylase RimI-like enzyme
MRPAPTPESARSDQLPAALALLFRSLPENERAERIGRALELYRRGELHSESTFVVTEDGEVRGALVCLIVAGASALIWPPQSVDDRHARQREDALVRHAVAWLRGRGVKLAQSLLAPEEVPLGAALERNGFTHVTHLWYLAHDLGLAPSLVSAHARLAFRSYPDAPPALFHQTLLATYEDTLDCPEVTGVRTVEEVITGHRAQGEHDPGRWWLALTAGQPVGVLMLTALPESGDWEVSYMGLVPAARRQGFGRELLGKALSEAKTAGVSRVTLSVDGRNGPAWDLYRAVGFEPFARREVFLGLWP